MAANVTLTIPAGIMAIATFAGDQISKWFLLDVIRIAERPPIEVAPFFNLVMVWNQGISFGLFAAQNQPWLLVGVSAIIITILLIWISKTTSMQVALALGSIIGGALGNVVDRLRFGAVADFFDFHVGSFHWPAFNIADAAIFIGVVLLCLNGMFTEHRNNPEVHL